MIFGKGIEFLNQMAKKQLVSATDIHLSEFLTSLDENLRQDEEKTVFAAAVALVSNNISNGNICLTEEEVAEFVETNGDLFESFRSFGFQRIKEVLLKSSCCTENPGADPKPVVISGNRIYFYKYCGYEESLAAKLSEISKYSGKYAERAGEIRGVFAKLFDGTNLGQMKAAETVIENRFSVITGGPGTGKTTTIAKILVGISALFPEERIMLAAPTGKASARMTEALKKAVSGNIRPLPGVASDEILDKISALEGTTIHKMLESKFGRFSRNKENPLAADLLIVDEAGMLDISLFLSLLDALEENASIVLLGDKDQLASVGVGNVLCDICSAAEKDLLPSKIVARLEKSYRFDADSGIGKLAKAVNTGKSGKEIIKICESESSLGFSEIKNSSDLAGIAKEAAKKYEFLSDIRLQPAEILNKLDEFKVLAPSKEDSFGVSELNKMIEFFLNKNPENGFYDGQPVMVTKNDYANGLMNGDCGVILERDGRKYAYFKVDNEVKQFNASSLTSLETVYAMTVHKSQGSEYDSVLIVLPERDMPILTKEILYTAVTRAKKEVRIAAKETVLDYTVRNSAARNSGFEEALMGSAG